MNKRNVIIIIVLSVILAALIGTAFMVNKYIKDKETVETFARTNYNQSYIYDKNENIIDINNNQIVNNTINGENSITNNTITNSVTEKKEDTNNSETESKSENTKEEIVTLPTGKNRKIDLSKPMVALTFDDGPNGKATPKILDTLEKYGVVATFFDLGQNMANYPKVVKREETIGCEVESHTYAHKNLNKLTSAQIKADMEKAEKVYQNVLGHKPSLVRPPYGNANSTVKSTLKYPLINWDIDTLDWKSRNAESVLKEIHKYSDYDGRIILMHGIYNSTAEAVEKLVPELIDNGYQLVTVSEMAKYKNVTLKNGTVYLNFR